VNRNRSPKWFVLSSFDCWNCWWGRSLIGPCPILNSSPLQQPSVASIPSTPNPGPASLFSGLVRLKSPFWDNSNSGAHFHFHLLINPLSLALLFSTLSSLQSLFFWFFYNQSPHSFTYLALSSSTTLLFFVRPIYCIPLPIQPSVLVREQSTSVAARSPHFPPTTTSPWSQMFFASISP